MRTPIFFTKQNPCLFIERSKYHHDKSYLLTVNNLKREERSKQMVTDSEMALNIYNHDNGNLEWSEDYIGEMELCDCKTTKVDPWSIIDLVKPTSLTVVTDFL